MNMDLEKNYRDNVEGKRAFTNELLKPLLLNIKMGWIDAYYEEDYDHGKETVTVVNANSDKTKIINVYGDSILGLTEDVMRHIFKF